MNNYQLNFDDIVVECEDVHKSYELSGDAEQVKALRGIYLHSDHEFFPILGGEFVMLRGPSGGGKTTLLNMIGTIDKVTKGKISLMGKEIKPETEETFLATLRLKKIGFVFQTFNLLATMSAFENVELPMMLLGIPKKERKRRAKLLLSQVGLGDRLLHLPSEMSGGECQRVAIARALSNNPKLLLLDEATGDLDTKNTIEIMDLLLRLNRDRRTTMIMVTHNPDLECYANRILYLTDGVLTKQIINTEQTRLSFNKYLEYLAIKENPLEDEIDEVDEVN